MRFDAHVEVVMTYSFVVEGESTFEAQRLTLEQLQQQDAQRAEIKIHVEQGVR